MILAQMKSYWEAPNFTLYKGDSLAILKNFPRQSFDMIFADPPYFLSGKGITKPKGDWDIPKNRKSELKFHTTWIKLCKNLLKPTGTIWITGTHHSIHTIGYILQTENFKIINEIAWHKAKNIPTLTGRQFPHSHETIIWAKPDTNKHFFNYNQAKKSGWLSSVWSVAPPQKSETKFGRHPTQKPTELLKRIILSSTKEGESILDPFCGSGTTGIVANFYNRKFTGVDQEESYLKIAERRYKNLRRP